MDNDQMIITLQETKDRSLRNEGRIEKLEGENTVIHKLATSVAVMAEQMKSMNASVNTLAGEVEDLKEKPGKRWDSLIDKIIWGIAGAILAYFLAQLGL